MDTLNKWIGCYLKNDEFKSRFFDNKICVVENDWIVSNLFFGADHHTVVVK